MKNLLFIIVLLFTKFEIYGIEIIDQKGRLIKLHSPIQRIVSIPIPAPSMIMAIDGSSEKLVGVHSLTQAAMKGKYLGRLFPEVLQLSSDFVGKGFNFMPNIERLLILKPDLVLQWGNYGSDIFDPIVAAGLNVAAIKIRNENDVLEWTRIISSALGKKNKAALMVGWRNELFELINTNSKKIKGKKKKILYFRHFRDNIQVAGRGTYNNYYIKLVGALNPASSKKGFYNITPEQVISWNPDIILLNSFELKLSPNAYIEHPVFSVTNAAVNKTVYSMPVGGYRWDPPNQESPLTWMWLGMLTNNRIHKYNLKKEIKKSYKMLYDDDVTDQDIHEILKIKINSNSKNYLSLFN